MKKALVCTVLCGMFTILALSCGKKSSTTPVTSTAASQGEKLYLATMTGTLNSVSSKVWDIPYKIDSPRGLENIEFIESRLVVFVGCGVNLLEKSDPQPAELYDKLVLVYIGPPLPQKPTHCLVGIEIFLDSKFKSELGHLENQKIIQVALPDRYEWLKPAHGSIICHGIIRWIKPLH